MRKLVACIACRNSGRRLYGKPLQNIDVENSISILDYIVSSLKQSKVIDSIVLGVSYGDENKIFHEVAQKHNISSIIGNEADVLSRLIKCCEFVKGSDIYRITSESPFFLFEYIDRAWDIHRNENCDFSCIDNVPNGSGFEIISLEAAKQSWLKGSTKHRSELCSLYIRENKKDFKINMIKVENELMRKDLRLTADYPEDLVLIRRIYENFKDLYPMIPLRLIINFLDENNDLKELVKKYVDEGMETMYV